MSPELGASTDPRADAAAWRAVLERIATEIARRDELLAAGDVSALRAEAFDVPDDLGPVPDEFVPAVHEIVQRLAVQQVAIERELTAISKELARYATARPGPTSRSVDIDPGNAFEARA